MAKQSRPKPNVCCPVPFPIREIIWGDTNDDTETYRILTESSDNLAAEDNNILRKE